MTHLDADSDLIPPSLGLGGFGSEPRILGFFRPPLVGCASRVFPYYGPIFFCVGLSYEE